MEKRQYARTTLVQSHEFIDARDFDMAVKENQKVLSLFVKGSPGDEALFNLALIYAHYDNPARDYKKSLGYLETLINEYPNTPLLEQAKTWEFLLQQFGSLEIKAAERKIALSKLESKLEEKVIVVHQFLQTRELLAHGSFKKALKANTNMLSLSKDKSAHDNALFNIALIYAHYNNPDRDYKKAIHYFSKLVKEFPDSPMHEEAKVWLDLLNVIEQAKQVDIEIEKKKKELAR